MENASFQSRMLGQCPEPRVFGRIRTFPDELDSRRDLRPQRNFKSDKCTIFMRPGANPRSIKNQPRAKSTNSVRSGAPRPSACKTSSKNAAGAKARARGEKRRVFNAVLADLGAPLGVPPTAPRPPLPPPDGHPYPPPTTPDDPYAPTPTPP